MSSNSSDGHLGFMQIRKVPQSCHSGKRWIWHLDALSNTNPSKKLTVPTISGFTMGHIQLATRLHYICWSYHKGAILYFTHALCCWRCTMAHTRDKHSRSGWPKGVKGPSSYPTPSSQNNSGSERGICL